MSILKHIKLYYVVNLMNELIHINIFLDMTIKRNPKFEEIVWVKFEEKMYRAKVFAKSGEEYTVFLMDVGKKIQVSADYMIEIPKNLKQVRYQQWKKSISKN